MYTLNAVKLRNDIHTINPGLEVELRNVRINGVLQGCTGFVTDPGTGRVVYVSTDRNHGTVSQALVRVAQHTRDYTGGPNHFVGFGATAHAVVDLLRADAEHARYVRS